MAYNSVLLGVGGDLEPQMTLTLGQVTISIIKVECLSISTTDPNIKSLGGVVTQQTTVLPSMPFRSHVTIDFTIWND